MPMPTVAVVMRTKDRLLLLNRAILSVASQTLKDVQLVIVNDGGDQIKIETVIKKYKSKFSNEILTIHNKKSLGMEVASNQGVKKSDSKYIAMLDDDDTWHKDFLKKTVEYLEKNKLKGVVTGSEIIWEEIKGNDIKETDRKLFAGDMVAINYFLLTGNNQFPNNAFIYARDTLKSVGYYDEGASVLGDWDFNVRFMNKYDIGYIDEPLARYHRRPEQGGSAGNSIFTMTGHHRAYKIKILNKYFRQDLEKGELGIGFAANVSELLYKNQQLLEEVERKIVSTKDRATELHGKLDRIEARLANIESLNTSLLKRSRRYVARRIKRSS